MTLEIISCVQLLCNTKMVTSSNVKLLTTTIFSVCLENKTLLVNTMSNQLVSLKVQQFSTEIESKPQE